MQLPKLSKQPQHSHAHTSSTYKAIGGSVMPDTAKGDSHVKSLTLPTLAVLDVYSGYAKLYIAVCILGQAYQGSGHLSLTTFKSTIKSIFNSLTTKFFKRKKIAGKKKKKAKILRWDSNPQFLALELNALPTWPLHYFLIFENYKTFIPNLSKKF